MSQPGIGVLVFRRPWWEVGTLLSPSPPPKPVPFKYGKKCMNFVNGRPPPLPAWWLLSQSDGILKLQHPIHCCLLKVHCPHRQFQLLCPQRQGQKCLRQWQFSIMSRTDHLCPEPRCALQMVSHQGNTTKGAGTIEQVVRKVDLNMDFSAWCGERQMSD